MRPCLLPGKTPARTTSESDGLRTFANCHHVMRPDRLVLGGNASRIGLLSPRAGSPGRGDLRRIDIGGVHLHALAGTEAVRVVAVDSRGALTQRR
jgi:hypothetical protein